MKKPKIVITDNREVWWIKHCWHHGIDPTIKNRSEMQKAVDSFIEAMEKLASAIGKLKRTP